MKRLLVCGSRHYADREFMEGRILHVFRPDVIIEGGARGADRLARSIAEQHGIAVETYPADWEQYGRAAGHIRNRQMLVEGKPYRVAAFRIGGAENRGTNNMIAQAEKAGIPVAIYNWWPE